jgi:3'-phosphoadenosine 5'-phosphosulfate sulfotransferase (PAPS reductase)/FAD synthetase
VAAARRQRAAGCCWAKFRWCTEGLKIRPSNAFIRDIVHQYGEAILVLGTRKAESQKRAATMTQHEKRRIRDRRDFRRMSGAVQLFHDRTIPGPYTKTWREHWLRRVLGAQQSIRTEGPPEFQDIQLITLEGLHEVRRIWL